MKDIKKTIYPQNLIDDIAKHTDVHLDVDYNKPDVMNGIAAAIATLSDQEQKMLLLRYRYHSTLEEVGAQFDITNERARQIIVRALRKLIVKPRRLLMTEGLEGYIEAEAKRIAKYKIKVALHQEYMRGYEKGFAVASGNAENTEESQEEKDETILVMDLNFSVRTTNCLVRAKLNTLEDVLKVASTDDIMKIRNLGKKSAGEVARRLNELGFLGTVWDEFIDFRHDFTPTVLEDEEDVFFIPDFDDED